MRLLINLIIFAALMGAAIMAKGQDPPSELVASVVVDAGAKAGGKNKGGPKFILTNAGKVPIRMCGFHQIWRHESASKIILIITSESFKSDAPNEKQLEKSIKILQPKMSFPIDLPSDLQNIKKDVEITYEVSETLAKKLDVWRGRLHLNLGGGIHNLSK